MLLLKLRLNFASNNWKTKTFNGKKLLNFRIVLLFKLKLVKPVVQAAS
jgi:hypothetical protein